MASLWRANNSFLKDEDCGFGPIYAGQTKEPAMSAILAADTDLPKIVSDTSLAVRPDPGEAGRSHCTPAKTVAAGQGKRPDPRLPIPGVDAIEGWPGAAFTAAWREWRGG